MAEGADALSCCASLEEVLLKRLKESSHFGSHILGHNTGKNDRKDKGAGRSASRSSVTLIYQAEPNRRNPCLSVCVPVRSSHHLRVPQDPTGHIHVSASSQQDPALLPGLAQTVAVSERSWVLHPTKGTVLAASSPVIPLQSNGMPSASDGTPWMGMAEHQRQWCWDEVTTAYPSTTGGSGGNK